MLRPTLSWLATLRERRLRVSPTGGRSLRLEHRRARSLFWGPHSTALQRQHTFLCLAYGAEPQVFEDFVTKFRWLPKQRADNCAREYEQVRHAFRETILPHLDIALVQKVRERKWLPASGN